MIIKIHGIKYNLSDDFVEIHPGGKDILAMAEKMDDAGVMFETYHAFARNRESIKRQLQKFAIHNNNDGSDFIISTNCNSNINNSNNSNSNSNRNNSNNNSINSNNNNNNSNSNSNNNSNTSSPVYNYDDYEELLQRVRKELGWHSRADTKAAGTMYLAKILILLILFALTITFAFTGMKMFEFSNPFDTGSNVGSGFKMLFSPFHPSSATSATLDSFPSAAGETRTEIPTSSIFSISAEESWYHILLRSMSAFGAGVLFIAIGFNAMHDASHFAVSQSPVVNLLIARMWNAFALWNNAIWTFHHVYAHHSFTGSSYDPDTRHYRPFAVKHPEDTKSWRFLRKRQHYTLSFFAFVFPGMYVGTIISYINALRREVLWGVRISPRIVFAQTKWFELLIYLTSIILSVYVIWQSHTAMFLVMFLLGANAAYHINIVADHDTFESTVTYRVKETPRILNSADQTINNNNHNNNYNNNYNNKNDNSNNNNNNNNANGGGSGGSSSSNNSPSNSSSSLCIDLKSSPLILNINSNNNNNSSNSNNDSNSNSNNNSNSNSNNNNNTNTNNMNMNMKIKADNSNNWAFIQISHSANFSMESMVWTHLFGGINYQIEHHLFPSVSHMLLPSISPIVQQFCKEKNYPYVVHSSAYTAYCSFLKSLKYCADL